jgi:hypothetical protein
MAVTRREFMVTTAAVAAAATIPVQLDLPDHPREAVAWIEGDPYRACAAEGGIGGREFYQSRDQAMRRRTPAGIRDTYVLGLERLDA